MQDFSITQWVDHFIKLFPKITKEESDYIEDILKWTDVQRAAFMMAKRIFEEKDEI